MHGVFCESIKAGIPLRECVSTGMATMDKQHEDWPGRIDYEGAVDIIDYYNRVEKWYKRLK